MAQDDIIGQIDAQLGGAATNQPAPTGQTIWPTRYINAPGTNVPVIGYTGPGLVGVSNNVEEQNQYDTSAGGIRNFYSNMTPRQRQGLLDLLKQKGYYGRGNVGDVGYDLNALSNFLDEANLSGVTWDRYLNETIRRRPNAGGGGGAPRRYRVSNPEDLKAVFRRSAQEILGRGFTDEEAGRAVQAYQQQEIAAQQAMYGGAQTVTEAPAADVFAQQYAQQIAPTEANAYKFLGILNRIANATTGGM